MTGAPPLRVISAARHVVYALALACLLLVGGATTAEAACSNASVGFPAGCVDAAASTYVSTQPGYKGWATVVAAAPAVADWECVSRLTQLGPCLQPATSIVAWQWNGAAWRQATRPVGEQVYAWPFATGWTWTWTAQSGWLAMRANHVLVSAAFVAATGDAFVHPGVVVSRQHLDLMRSRVAAGSEPWASAFARLRSSRHANVAWTPHPFAYVRCGNRSGGMAIPIQEGCAEEIDDAIAAYTLALAWYATGNQAYANRSIVILNAWSAVLKDHPFDSVQYGNGRLQAAWAAEIFTKAAEIIRYSNAGWSAADIARFEHMLTTAFLPRVQDGWRGGGMNWIMSMAEATMDIGVFTNRRAAFNEGLADWRAQVRSAIYMREDGATPILPVDTFYTTATVGQFWHGATFYASGLSEETCRDVGHAALGFAAMLNAAETARLQGVDLYGEHRTRIVTGMEYHARFLNDPSASGWPCPAPLNWGGTASRLTWEIGYNHYAERLGSAMPQTRQWLRGNRPTAAGLHEDWETLTHGAPGL